MCKASETSRNTDFTDPRPLFTEHHPPAQHCPGPVRSHVLWICLLETQDKATFFGQRRISLKSIPLQMSCSFKERSYGIPSYMAEKTSEDLGRLSISLPPSHPFVLTCLLIHNQSQCKQKFPTPPCIYKVACQVKTEKEQVGWLFQSTGQS